MVLLKILVEERPEMREGGTAYGEPKHLTEHSIKVVAITVTITPIDSLLSYKC